MADIVYKKFSELTQTTTLVNNDLFPIAQYITGTSYNSKAITVQTLYNQTSGVLISPFTTSIQTAVNATLSSDTWNSTYSTVQSNSAAWGATSTDLLSAFSQGNISSPQVVRFLSAGTTPNASVAFIATGTGATLAQLPDNGVGGGNARGQYATDWQKLRTDATQVASGNYSVIGGGSTNKVATDYSVIGGGLSNTNSSTYGVIGGGLSNSIDSLSLYGGVGAGRSNSLSGTYSYIGGGFTNTIQDDDRSIIGGGTDNIIYSGGGRNAICGGGTNSVSGSYIFVGGGLTNIASGEYSSVVGGQNNNTNNKQNAHIIGSNIVAVSADYTYVNNISSQGVIAGNVITANRQIFSTSANLVLSTPTTITVNVSSASRFIYTFDNDTGADAVTVNIDNIAETIGAEVVIYFLHATTGSKTISLKYNYLGSYLALPIAVSFTSVGQAAVSSFVLLANGLAAVTVTNVGGNVVAYAV